MHTLLVISLAAEASLSLPERMHFAEVVTRRLAKDETNTISVAFADIAGCAAPSVAILNGQPFDAKKILKMASLAGKPLATDDWQGFVLQFTEDHTGDLQCVYVGPADCTVGDYDANGCTVHVVSEQEDLQEVAALCTQNKVDLQKFCFAHARGLVCTDGELCLYSHDFSAQYAGPPQYLAGGNLAAAKEKMCFFFFVHGRCDYGDNCRNYHFARKPALCMELARTTRCSVSSTG
jgi:hypothetical protein